MDTRTLTPKELRFIFDTYETICGGHIHYKEQMDKPYGGEVAEWFLSEVREDLDRWGYAEYRFGSRWDMNSKLWFYRDRAEFNSNMSPSDIHGRSARFLEAEEAGRRFKEAIDTHFARQGLVRVLHDYILSRE